MRGVGLDVEQLRAGRRVDVGRLVERDVGDVGASLEDADLRDRARDGVDAVERVLAVTEDLACAARVGATGLRRERRAAVTGRRGCVGIERVLRGVRARDAEQTGEARDAGEAGEAGKAGQDDSSRKHGRLLACGLGPRTAGSP